MAFDSHRGDSIGCAIWLFVYTAQEDREHAGCAGVRSDQMQRQWMWRDLKSLRVSLGLLSEGKLVVIFRGASIRCIVEEVAPHGVLGMNLMNQFYRQPH